LDADISRWYVAYAAHNYGTIVQQAFRQVVRRIGTGPWGAGVWFGDSQQYFLTVWLATTLLAGPTLDYYLYDHFCENPANQCFLLGGKVCGACIQTGKVAGNPVNPSRCGAHNIWDMLWQFKGRLAQDLYIALKSVGGPPAQIFDLLGAGRPDSRARPARPISPTSTPAPPTTSQAPTPPPTTPATTSTSPPAPPVTAPPPQAEELREGSDGGVCICRDDFTYEVGDKRALCHALACEFGVPSPCTEDSSSGKSKCSFTCMLHPVRGVLQRDVPIAVTCVQEVETHQSLVK